MGNISLCPFCKDIRLHYLRFREYFYTGKVKEITEEIKIEKIPIVDWKTGKETSDKQYPAKTFTQKKIKKLQGQKARTYRRLVICPGCKEIFAARDYNHKDLVIHPYPGKIGNFDDIYTKEVEV